MSITTTAASLVDNLMMDDFPRPAVAVDFGIDLVPDLYAKYQQAVRKGQITESELAEAVGDGPALTKLFKEKTGEDVCITTQWDLIPDEE